jgi:hypothetical protein
MNPSQSSASVGVRVPVIRALDHRPLSIGVFGHCSFRTAVLTATERKFGVKAAASQAGHTSVLRDEVDAVWDPEALA